MATVDRQIRNLSGLKGASSSRVLNLAAIAEARADDPGHRARPFFDSPVLNNAIVVKHRLRADEVDAFAVKRELATKVIIPFERRDLRSGGRSMFVGQRGFDNLLADVGNYGESLSMKHDQILLRLLDELPSLDPFLLREHLRANEMFADESYFAISLNDQQRMFAFTAKEIQRLTTMAMADARAPGGSSTARLVEALLSSEGTDRLEPLRLTLQLEAGDFQEGMFGWRGFLYYKWSLGEFWPQTIKVMRDVQQVRPVGAVDKAQSDYIKAARRKLVTGVYENCARVRALLDVYEDAYSQLIEHRDPRRFRKFLLDAPPLFMQMGERVGALSHITSFWNYRFPPGAPRTADSDELASLFRDFLQGLGAEIEAA